MTLPKSLAGWFAILAVFWLTGCSFQKRTTAPGWHVERASRHALSVQVHTPKPNDNLLLERSDHQKLIPVVPRASKSVHVSRVDRRLGTLREGAFARALQAQEGHEEKDSRCEVPEHGSATSTTTTAGIMSPPDWQDEVLRLLESARKNRRLVVVYLSLGVSWLVAARHQTKAELLCANHGSNLESVAPEALKRAKEMKKGIRTWFAWFWLGYCTLGVVLLGYVGFGLGFFYV